MSKGRNVYQDWDGYWVNERLGSGRVGSLHRTQRAAVAAAREMLLSVGGGELTVRDADNRVSSRETVGGGNERRSIRGLEH
jgi:hypothetical protein